MVTFFSPMVSLTGGLRHILLIPMSFRSGRLPLVSSIPQNDESESDAKFQTPLVSMKKPVQSSSTRIPELAMR